ncbi:MAG: HIT family hydrolase [Anaerolineales bacterium]|nr:HIT family hydrolase [Anaerolineales bacterium]
MKTKDFLGNEWDGDCMGCAISEGSASVPGGLIKRTQFFLVNQDPLIPLPGFLVVASTRHIRSISEMDDFEYDEFSKLIRDTHRAIKDVTRIESLTIVQEERSNHFHLWFFPWTQNVIERYGQPSLAKIREIMADYKTRTIDESEWKELESSITKIKDRLTGS